MTKLFALLLFVFSLNAYSAGSTPLPADVKVLANSGRAGALQTVQLGTQLIDHKVQVLKAVYDFSVLGGASGASLSMLDEGGKPATLPNKAVIKQVIFDAVTTVVGAASVTVGANTSSDLKSAVAATAFSGITAGTPVGTAATSVKATAERIITWAITTGTITAGKVNAFIEYYVSE